MYADFLIKMIHMRKLIKHSDAVTQRGSVKKVFLKVQNSQESACTKVSILIKLHAKDLQLY